MLDKCEQFIIILFTIIQRRPLIMQVYERMLKSNSFVSLVRKLRHRETRPEPPRTVAEREENL